MVTKERQEMHMFHIDKEFINPDIPRPIRFTQILFDWLKEVSEREGISFNQTVLQCCKNARDEDLSAHKNQQEEPGDD